MVPAGVSYQRMFYKHGSRIRLFAAGMGLALYCAVPAAAQVIGIGDDGSSRMMCTAAQNKKPFAARRPAQSSAMPPAYRAMLERAARIYEISPDLLDVLAHQESAYNQRARSPKGAIGIMQLMPATARALGVDAFDAEQNIMGGAAYLRYMLNVYDGHIDLALSAYNAGQNAVNRYGGIPPFKETRAYLARNFDHLAQKSGAGEAALGAEPETQSAYIQECR